MTRRGALGLRSETATPMRQGVWCLLPVVLNAVPETHGNQRVVRPCDVQTHGCVCVCVHASVLASNPNVTLLPLQTEKTISDICTRETPTVPDSHMVRDTTSGPTVESPGGLLSGTSCMRACTCACMRAYVCMYVYVCVCLCVCVCGGGGTFASTSFYKCTRERGRPDGTTSFPTVSPDGHELLRWCQVRWLFRKL